MKEHEKTFFLPREPVRPIGVYFSQKSRNYFAKEFMESYRGVLMLLLQSHLEFQIVTPRTLDGFHGKALILPDARCLGKQELDSLGSHAGSGKTLIVRVRPGIRRNWSGWEANLVHKQLGITNTAQKKASKKFIYYPNCPGRAYYAQLAKEFNDCGGGTLGADGIQQAKRAFAADIAEVSDLNPAVESRRLHLSSPDRQVDVGLGLFGKLQGSEIQGSRTADSGAERNRHLFRRRAGHDCFSSLSGPSAEGAGSFQGRQADWQIAAHRQRRNRLARVAAPGGSAP
jgi:hypothetical protein